MADRIAWTATLKRDAEKNNNSSMYEEFDDTDGYATLVRTRFASDVTDSQIKNKNACCPGCSPRFTYAFSYGMALFAFLLAVNFKQLPDPSLYVPPWSTHNAKHCNANSTSCWQSLLIGNLLNDEYLLREPDEVVIGVMVLWGLHFLRRFAEVLFLHDYRRRVWKTECILLPLYHLVMSFWIGWSCNYYLGYFTPFYPILISGAVLFIVGEIGNCAGHVRLFKLRRKPYSAVEMERTPSQHVLPKGFLFQVICCPHYVFEIITWIGFSILSCTLASYVFAFFTLIIMCVKGRMRYSAYCREFHGRSNVPRYNKKRKAIIPYIL